jgi:hypothetical protein
VELRDVQLGLLARLRRNNGAPVVMDLQHQSLRVLPGESEDTSEHQRHVRHEVDGIVPDDDEPGTRLFDGLVADGYRERIEYRVEHRRALRGESACESAGESRGHRTTSELQRRRRRAMRR